MNIPGGIQINKLLNMDPARLAFLPVEDLAAMQKEVDTLLLDAKTIKRLFDELLEQRYSNRARNVRASHGKDTGTVHFDDGPVIVTADLPKRVKWDQTRLGAIRARICLDGDDPDEFISILYKVSEQSYSAWP